MVAAVTRWSLPSVLRQILHKRVELLLRKRLPERRRHDALREALLDVGVRVDDRLADERVERLSGPLRLGGELVEVRADLAGCVRRFQRVARVAAVAREESGSGGGTLRRRCGGRRATLAL